MLTILLAGDVLLVLGGDAGAGSTADHDGLSQDVGSGIVDVGTRNDDLAGLELHLTGRVADVSDLTNGLDVVTGVNGSQELDVVISAEQALIAVLDDQQLGSNVTEQVDHVGAVDQVSAVMGVLSAHAESQHRLNSFHVCFLLKFYG